MVAMIWVWMVGIFDRILTCTKVEMLRKVLVGVDVSSSISLTWAGVGCAPSRSFSCGSSRSSQLGSSRPSPMTFFLAETFFLADRRFRGAHKRFACSLRWCSEPVVIGVMP